LGNAIYPGVTAKNGDLLTYYYYHHHHHQWLSLLVIISKVTAFGADYPTVIFCG